MAASDNKRPRFEFSQQQILLDIDWLLNFTTIKYPVVEDPEVSKF